MTVGQVAAGTEDWLRHPLAPVVAAAALAIVGWLLKRAIDGVGRAIHGLDSKVDALTVAHAQGQVSEAETKRRLTDVEQTVGQLRGEVGVIKGHVEALHQQKETQ